MLRFLVVLLILANALYLSWTKNWLAQVGLPSVMQVKSIASNNEQIAPLNPQSVQLITMDDAQQTQTKSIQQPESTSSNAESPTVIAKSSGTEINPFDLSLVNLNLTDLNNDDVGQHDKSAEQTTNANHADSASLTIENNTPTPASLESAPQPTAQKPKICQAISSFDESEIASIRQILQSWPSEQWRISSSTKPTLWMVFWGGVNDDLVIKARRATLKEKKIDFERLYNNANGPGFSLGRLSTQEAAQAHKNELQAAGISDLQIVQDQPVSKIYKIDFLDYEANKHKIQRQLKHLLGKRKLKPCLLNLAIY